MEVALPGTVATPSADRVKQQGRISAAKFLVVLAQLGLFTLVLRQFQIESGAFLRLALLAFAGFAVHAWLPLRYRLPFFLALSLAGIVLVLGVANGAWLVGIGLVLIGICHLPFAFAVRALRSCSLVAAVLVAQRAQWMPAPWSEAIWPILGSMFMFRLIVYLYDLRHDTAPAVAAACAVVLLHAAECVLPAVSGGRLQDLPAQLLRRRRVPHLPDRRRLDGARRHSSHSLSRRLLLPDAGAVGGSRPRRSRAVHGRQLPAVPASIGPVPPDRRHAVPVRLPAAGDPPQVLPRVELHGLLAPHQHLLEGLHAEGVLLPGVLQAAPVREHRGARARDAASCS